jgi:hypothetical protein
MILGRSKAPKWRGNIPRMPRNASVAMENGTVVRQNAIRAATDVLRSGRSGRRGGYRAQGLGHRSISFTPRKWVGEPSTGTLVRRVLAQAEMGAASVAIHDVRREQSAQVCLTENDVVVEALARRMEPMTRSANGSCQGLDGVETGRQIRPPRGRCPPTSPRPRRQGARRAPERANRIAS